MQEPSSSKSKVICLIATIGVMGGASLISYYWVYHVGDTSFRRRATAREITKAAEAFRRDNSNRTAFMQIVEIAEGDYRFGRTYAIATLGELGPDASSALPVLRKALMGSDRFASREAAIAIGQIGPAAQSAVPDLVQLLDREGVDISWFAAEALGEIGYADSNVIEALERAESSSDPMLIKAATESLNLLRSTRDKAAE